MFNPAWTILNKRDGKELSATEIQTFIEGVKTGAVADYQATAFLMATFFQGMTLSETMALTTAMLESGDRYDLSSVPGSKVDKHSTGGVGDKVSLILAPLAAACGLKVPMMSGRGLGHSGGTLDKLESIPGFNVKMDQAEFKRLLKDIGCAMIGQSETIAPADRKLYALRDVTGTVECIPLITASILSKKLAEGCQGLVLDVKCGSGAFMKTLPKAKALTKTLTQVARKMGLKCKALITNMEQPLGYAVGNSLEVMESIQILKNEKPQSQFCSSDLRELTLQLCAHMLEAGGICKTVTQGKKLAAEKLADGSAWKVFQELCKRQGGDLSKLPFDINTPFYPVEIVEWKAKKSGFITSMDTESLGRVLVELGGGRKKASDTVNPGVGLLFHKKLGASVKSGQVLATIHAPKGWNADSKRLQEIETLFQNAIQIGKTRKSVPKLVFAVY